MNKMALVVDDSNTMRKLVSSILSKQAGFEIVEAEDGVDALKKLENTDVSFVATDFNMPNMNGGELIRNLRQNPKYKAIPILVITTDVTSKGEARSSGATGWIKKPFSSESLLKVVGKIYNNDV